MSTILVNTLTGTSTAGSIAVTGEGNSTTTNLQQGLAKAWTRYNGNGTVAIDDSFNTASLTDNGVGIYTTAWTSAFGNANYSAAGFCESLSDSDSAMVVQRSSDSFAAGSLKHSTMRGDNNFIDSRRIGINTFGDLA